MKALTPRRVALAVVIALVVAAVFSFGPLVRSRAKDAAARYGAEIEIAWVKPAWGRVVLEGVSVKHPEAPGVRVRLDRVEVSMSSPRTVKVRGGLIELDGDPEVLEGQIEKVRAGIPTGGSGSGAGTTYDIAGLGLRYQGAGMVASAEGVDVERVDGGVVVAVENIAAKHASFEAKVAGGSLELARTDDGTRVKRLSTAAVELELSVAGITPIAQGVDAIEETSGDAPLAGRRVRRLRQTLGALERRADGLLAPDGSIELGGLRATITGLTHTLSLGPAKLVVQRKDAGIGVEYQAGTPPPGGGLDPAADFLVIRSRLPKDGEGISVEVRGGPISLATLGVRENDFHLVEVDGAKLRTEAKIEIDPTLDVASFDGDASIAGLSFHDDAIAKDPVRGVKASFRGKVRVALDKSHLHVQGGEIEIGTVRLATTFDLTHEPPRKKGEHPRLRMDGTFEVPLVACQAFLDVAPEGLLPTVAGMRMAGSLALKGTARFDTANLDREYAVKWDLSNTCRVTDVPPTIDVARFRAPFKRTVYSTIGEKTVEVETGPTTAAWVPLSNISRFVETAVVSFEDAGFRRHEGFDAEAIRNSMRENLRTLKFVRGASTISMQLAKNLYLSRDKRLSRKLEEALLTLYLEQALTKDQILELYLNVVEFGPMVYGVDAAALHYFRMNAARLTVSQAFFIGSILPSPTVEHFAAGGALSPGWLKNIRTVMKYANKRQRLSDEDLATGLAEIPVRGTSVPQKDPNAEPVPTVKIEDTEPTGEP